MHSNTQVFFDFCRTLRALLTRTPCINLTKEFITLQAFILDDISELPEASIKHRFTQHSLGKYSVIQILKEDHTGIVTKQMSLLEMKVFSRVVNSVVNPSNFDTLFLVIYSGFQLSRLQIC